jgi:hypothetical protein
VPIAANQQVYPLGKLDGLLLEISKAAYLDVIDKHFSAGLYPHRHYYASIPLITSGLEYARRQVIFQ